MRAIPTACILVSVLGLAAGSCSGSDVEVATTTTATAATTTSVATATTTEPAGTLVWEPCGRAECAALTVPLDHEDPSQGTIDLAVARWPAQRPDERIGVLLYNPGGPGEPGTPIIIDGVGWSFSSALLDRFDVVSWVRGGAARQPRWIVSTTLKICWSTIRLPRPPRRLP